MIIRTHRNGSVTITGLSAGDLRLVARAVDAGSFEGGDQGGDVSHALLRLERGLRAAANYGGTIELISGTSDATVMFEEPINLTAPRRAETSSTCG